MRRRLLARAAAALAGALGLLALILALNTWRQPSRQVAVPAVAPVAVDAQAVAGRLAAAVRLRTVSVDGQPDAAAAEYLKLHDWLAASYPQAHAALRRETVGGYSLLYTWPGTDAGVRPMMLMAHQDVVPIAPNTERDWQAEPFAGTVRDGFVWGRGAWDDKGNLVAMMEAVELLARQGFRPRRTLYLAFGHDEETGGERGAAQIAALLKSRGVRLDFVIDEGLLITDGVLKGLDAPLALVGVAEKGYVNLQLTTHGTPGHASMPPPATAIGTLAQALQRIESQPMPAGIRGVAAEMFARIAPEMSAPMRVVLSNLWLFGPLVRHQLEQGPSTNAMLRSTSALTVVAAGNKANVLPGEATANVNVRLLPGDTVAAAVDHARQVVANPAVEVATAPGMQSEASPVSPVESPSYRLIERTVRELFPGTVVAPGLMIGATDSRHLLGLADQVYRFSPVRARAEDLPRFHGTNERISTSNLAELVAFYHRLLVADAQAGLQAGVQPVR
ncbi:M20 family peptidase [Aquincola tertiaricarbonis]|uniref:M20 family peptidase n=1 Tax=Aquincola tertiaricarbonis TaxID=391953 RepID=UPI0006153E6D|nr:M20 family peptidase [Aquincola tertiaricarbonis]